MNQHALIANINNNIAIYNQLVPNHLHYKPIQHLAPKHDYVKLHEDTMFLQDVNVQIQHNITRLKLIHHDRTKYIQYKSRLQ